MTRQEALLFLTERCTRATEVTSWHEWLAFKRSSRSRNWLYLYAFSESVLAWGTCSSTSDRLRKASLFHPKLTGKYDRRVDYLMLKEIHGMPRTWVLEAPGKAIEVESQLKSHLRQTHCFLGLAGPGRREISHGILRQFRATPHWNSLSKSNQEGFDEYLDRVYFVMPRHPQNPSRTFYWGDSLEPGFLGLLGLGHLEAAIEATLRVMF